MTKQTFQATNSLIKQTPSSYFKSNPKIQYSDNSFKVKPTKMLSVCGGRGLRPDPPSPTGVNLLLLLLDTDAGNKLKLWQKLTWKIFRLTKEKVEEL